MKNTVSTLLKQKQSGDKITMLTAYDYTTAKIIDECGVNAILIGDSLGMVMLGYENTLPVTMEDMIHHTAAVSRGAENAFIVADIRSVYRRLLSMQADLSKRAAPML